MEMPAPQTEPLEVRLKRLEPGLRAFVRSRFGRLAGVEGSSDVRQSVWRRLFGRAGQYEPMTEDHLRRCVHRLANEVLADHLRYHERLKRRGRPAVLGEDGLDGVVSPQSAEPAAELVRRESAQVVVAAVDELPEPARSVVRWSVLDGVAHAEIGRRLGRSEDACKMLLHRALARLARRLS